MYAQIITVETETQVFPQGFGCLPLAREMGVGNPGAPQISLATTDALS